MNVKKRKMIAAIALTFAAGILMSRADTHYVSLDGTNDVANGYITWSGAATQIQWAVDAAQATTAGDTVLVSNGTYNLTNQIMILSNITVQSVNGTNFTFINGNYPAYTNRCIFMLAGTLDGLTISNGFMTNSSTNYPGPYPYAMGGAGIAIRGGATVKNCYIYKNFITNYGGGGIHVSQATGVTITNCSVVSNTCTSGSSGYGGGIYLAYAYNPGLLIDSYISGNVGGHGGGVANNDADGRITNCTIAGNTAYIGAGGLHLQAIYSVMAANCVISNNTGAWGGGANVYRSSLINSVIIGNSAGQRGGVNVTGGGGAMLSNCQVIGNTATIIGGVGLSGVADSTSVIANCIIARNVCDWNNSSGGLQIESGGLVKNCLIYCNTNSQGGGGVRLNNNALYTNYPYGLINCTIVDNVSPHAAGIRATGSNNYVVNCIVVSNVTAAGAPTDIFNYEAANTNNYWHTCTPDILPPNQGNITSDPLFVDRPDYNYRQSAGSPCINAGTNWNWTATDVDLDGRMRIRYGTVDMGAYEFIRSGSIYGFH